MDVKAAVALVAGCAMGCTAEITVAIDGEADGRACVWQAREPVILPGDPTRPVHVIGSRTATVAVVYEDYTEGNAVVRWRWDAEPTGGEARRLPFGWLAHGPDETVAVIALGDDEGSYSLVEEDGSATALDEVPPEVRPRWLGPEEADGRRLLLTDSLVLVQAMQARRIPGAPSEDIGPVACGGVTLDVLTREEGDLAAVATFEAIDSCRGSRGNVRVIEVVALDGRRELRHLVTPREGLTPPIYVADVRLLDTEGGPTLLWHDGQACGYFCRALPHDVVRWLQPLDPSGRPLGEAVALPPAWGWEGAGAAAMGDAVAMIGMDNGHVVIRLVARDGTLEETLPLPLELPNRSGPATLVASPDARTLVVAAAQSQGITVLHYDCVDPAGS